jgi:hypothetical protein
MGFLWTRYLEPGREDAREARVDYSDGPPLPRLVQLPSGITARARHDIVDKLGITAESLLFTNAPGDGVALRGSAWQPLSFPEKVERAKQLVKTFLADVVAPTGTSVAGLADIVTALPVEPVNAAMFGIWMQTNQIIGSKNAGSTEGVTTSKDRGARKVAINLDFHTLYAIVHELFHVVEANTVASLGPGLYEGLTEFMTITASGLDIRRDRTGQGYTYRSNLHALRTALADFPLVTEPDLYKAYFEGDLTAIKRSFESTFYDAHAV